jgi:hypothetical protein
MAEVTHSSETSQTMAAPGSYQRAFLSQRHILLWPECDPRQGASDDRLAKRNIANCIYPPRSRRNRLAVGVNPR